MKKHLVVGACITVFAAFVLHVVFAQDSGSGEYEYEYSEYSYAGSSPVNGCTDSQIPNSNGSINVYFDFTPGPGNPTFYFGDGGTMVGSSDGLEHTYASTTPSTTYNPYVIYQDGSAQYFCGPVTVGTPSVNAPPSNGSSAVTGWAWSSNIGWISFNGSGYGVEISTTSATSLGTFSGDAWSSNIGWIQFGGLSSFPTNGTSAANATIDLNASDSNAGQVSGWVRACAGTANGDCASPSRTDGWDGWIELSGANHNSPDITGNSGVTFNPTSGLINGWAWGGNVVGWVNFNASCSGCLVVPSNQVTLTGTCSPSPSSLPAGGGSVTFTANADTTIGTGRYKYDWNNTGYVLSNTDPTPAQYTTSGAGLIVPIEDSASPVDMGSIQCSGVTVAGVPPTSISVQVGPDTSHLSSLYQVPQGGVFALEWTIPTDDSEGNAFTACSVSSGSFSPPPWTTSNVWNSTTGTPISSNLSGIAIGNTVSAGSYTFTVTCSAGSDPSQSGSATLRVTSSHEHEAFNYVPESEI